MLIELGNTSPKGHDGAAVDLGAPTVTQIAVPDEYTFDAAKPLLGGAAFSVDAVKEHLYDAVLAGGGITRLPDHEAILPAIHPMGAWPVHSLNPRPSWVACDNPAVEAFLQSYWDVPARPDDVHDTHWTVFGAPGVGPAANPVEALLVNSGRDIWARNMGGGPAAGSTVGASGTSTGTTATTLVDSGASWTSNAFVGQRVFVGGVFGVIQSNTGTSLTIDRWSNVTTPGGTAGSTPGATSAYAIVGGGGPAWFVALGNTNTAANASDTSLSDEITTSGGGLIRRIAPFSHTSGVNTYALTPVWTVNSSDSPLPVTVYRIGVFTSMVVAATASTMAFETLLSAAATLSAIGDQLTVTETVTGS